MKFENNNRTKNYMAYIPIPMDKPIKAPLKVKDNIIDFITKLLRRTI